MHDMTILKSFPFSNLIKQDTTVLKIILYFLLHASSLTHISNTLHAHESHVAVSHISEVPVLSRSEVGHPASVVGLLIEEPVAVHHMAGLAVRHTETIHDVFTVIHQFIHLSSEVVPLVDPHSVGSPVL